MHIGFIIITVVQKCSYNWLRSNTENLKGRVCVCVRARVCGRQKW